MRKIIRSANFGNLSKQIAKQDNSIQEKVDDDFNILNIEVLDEYRAIIDFVNNKGQVMFLTGKAGTGKSTAIKYIKRMIPKSIVIAPTAIAAFNVKGSTIHSFFGFPPNHFDPKTIHLPKPKLSIIKDLDLLIIDEVSMVTPSLVDAIDISLKKSKNTNKAFGGIPVLFVGDLFQLPPVIEDEEIDKFYGGEGARYDSKYFFSADIFKELNEVQAIELNVVRRQDQDANEDNQRFIQALNTIRSQKDSSYSHIDFINQKCYEDKKDNTFENAITLVPTKSKAASVNRTKLDNIDSPSKIYKGHLDGLSSEQIKGFQVPDELSLKIGTQVVFVKNNNTDWLNGDLGTVTALDEDIIQVRVHKTGLVKGVTREVFEKYEYKYNTEKQNIELKSLGKYHQFPLNLGWAITIHKSQGMTLEKAIVDIDENAFTQGQTYVALSRVRSIEGLKLDSPITIGDIKIDDSIVQFYKGLFEDDDNLDS